MNSNTEKHGNTRARKKTAMRLVISSVNARTTTSMAELIFHQIKYSIKVLCSMAHHFYSGNRMHRYTQFDWVFDLKIFFPIRRSKFNTKIEFNKQFKCSHPLGSHCEFAVSGAFIFYYSHTSRIYWWFITPEWLRLAIDLWLPFIVWNTRDLIIVKKEITEQLNGSQQNYFCENWNAFQELPLHRIRYFNFIRILASNHEGQLLLSCFVSSCFV